MGGMLAATFLAIFFVPLFYKVITERKLGESRSEADIRAEAAHAHALARSRVNPKPGHHVLPGDQV